MKRRILIGADIVPTKTNVELFINGDARTLLGEELYSFFRKQITEFSILKLLFRILTSLF